MKIYANKQTRIAHADNKRGDSCRRSLTLRRNVVRFTSLGDARDEGYRACKRCKPE